MRHLKQITENDEDEEKEGLILNDDDCVRALKNRDDIFLIKKESLLFNIEVVILAIGVIFGVWLSTMQAAKVKTPYHKTIVHGRIARLVPDKQNFPSTVANKIEVKSTTDKQVLIVRKSLTRKDGLLQAGLEAKKAPIVNHTRAQMAIDTTYPQRVTVNPLAAAPETTTKEDSVFTSFGLTYKKKGMRVEAFTSFRNVLKHNPHDTVALVGMGDLFLQTGILDSAEAFYKTALAVNPRIATVHNSLGSILFFNSTLAENPRFSEYRKISNAAEYITAQYDSAIIEYTNAISLDSSCVDAITNRGIIREIHGDRKTAIADYSLAIRINPSWAEAYVKRAAAYKSSGKFNEAVTDYTSAIKLDSGSYVYSPTLHFANAYFGRGNTFFKMGELDKAIADFDSTIILSPSHSLAMIKRAIALSDKKQYEKAIIGFTRAISLLAAIEYNGSRKTAYFDRGNAYKMLGMYDSAIADYTNAIEPKLAAKACWRIAECYALKNDKENTIAWLKKAISYGFTDFKSWKQDRDLLLVRDDKVFRDIIK